MKKVLFLCALMSLLNGYLQKPKKIKVMLCSSQIEALASQEPSGRNCYGLGTIICPATGMKVLLFFDK